MANYHTFAKENEVNCPKCGELAEKFDDGHCIWCDGIHCASCDIKCAEEIQRLKEFKRSKKIPAVEPTEVQYNRDALIDVLNANLSKMSSTKKTGLFGSTSLEFGKSLLVGQ